MGWMFDLLKEIPLSAVLKEKIADIEARHAATETENAILKDDLRKAKAEIAKLKEHVEEFTHDDQPPNEIELGVLQLVVMAADYTFLDNIASRSPHSQEVVQYHLLNLVNSGYIEQDRIGKYLLTQKAREVLIEKKILR